MSTETLLHSGRQALDAGHFATARVMAEEAVRTAGDDFALAGALTLLAAALHRTDAYAEGLATGTRALRLWHELGDQRGESLTRSTLSRILVLAGDMDEALGEAMAALELADLAADLDARRVALTAVGIVHLSLRKHESAMQYTERAAETARLDGAVTAHGNLIDTIGCVFLSMAYEARERGDSAAATAYATRAAEECRRAAEIARGAGHRYYEGTATGNLAEALAVAGRPEEALAVMESFRVDPAVDVISMVTQYLDCHGCICAALGRYDEAIALYTEALRLAAGDNTAMWYCEHLAEVCERAGDLRAALDYHKRFHALFKQVASENAQRSADVAAIRLETAQAISRAEELLQQSLEDPLTGLANRRFLDHMLVAGQPGLAVAMIDVDHFKSVNDRFSHQAGDEVLRRLGDLLRTACRPGDTAARYGGEEFAVLIGGDAGEFADRIRARVEAYPWAEVHPELAITVSIGVAESTEAAGPEALLALADSRLYAAKRGGRNRVVSRS
ncbi:tetratricopeptide repeat-containing diguanylate cyclase [Actinoplanes sp. NPDC023714]|uniref:GGDEF domain-containing protein n=1 Tax=Actinoplanes sp. NPDC023714 TaxID=3154322 RepID=UPI00340A643D